MKRRSQRVATHVRSQRWLLLLARPLHGRCLELQRPRFTGEENCQRVALHAALFRQPLPTRLALQVDVDPEDAIAWRPGSDLLVRQFPGATFAVEQKRPRKFPRFFNEFNMTCDSKPFVTFVHILALETHKKT